MGVFVRKPASAVKRSVAPQYGLILYVHCVTLKEGIVLRPIAMIPAVDLGRGVIH